MHKAHTLHSPRQLATVWSDKWFLVQVLFSLIQPHKPSREVAYSYPAYYKENRQKQKRSEVKRESGKQSKKKSFSIPEPGVFLYVNPLFSMNSYPYLKFHAVLFFSFGVLISQLGISVLSNVSLKVIHERITGPQFAISHRYLFVLLLLQT